MMIMMRKKSLPLLNAIKEISKNKKREEREREREEKKKNKV